MKHKYLHISAEVKNCSNIFAIKFNLEQAVKAWRGSRGLALLLL